MKRVYQLANPKKPIVAWLSTLPMTQGFDPQSGQTREEWVTYQQAQQLFDVRPLAPTADKIDATFFTNVVEMLIDAADTLDRRMP